MKTKSHPPFQRAHEPSEIGAKEFAVLKKDGWRYWFGGVKVANGYVVMLSRGEGNMAEQKVVVLSDNMDLW
jgi:hypothetical protein